MAEGGMRDALSLLEQCLAYNPDALTLEDVEHIFGLTSVKEEVGLFIDVHNNRISDVVSKLRNMYVQGADTKRLAIDLLEIVKDALIYSDQGKDVLLNRLTATEAQEILKVTSVTELLKDAKDLEETLLKEKQNQNFLVYLELCLIRIAGRNKTEPEKIQITKEREEEKTEAEAIAVPEPDIIIEETEEIPVEPIIEYNIDFLLSILLDANRDLKINDQIIYNKLDLYRYEPDKRKFYQLLIGTELFASNKDAIIISGNKAQADNINTRSMNEELYFFLNEEFGIDKMVYGIDEAKKKQLIGLYKETPVERRNRPVYIEKYTKKAAANQTQEDKLRELFGDRVKVEE